MRRHGFSRVRAAFLIQLLAGVEEFSRQILQNRSLPTILTPPPRGRQSFGDPLPGAPALFQAAGPVSESFLKNWGQQAEIDWWRNA